MAQWDANKEQEIINSSLFEGLKDNHAIDESFLTSKISFQKIPKKIEKEKFGFKTKIGADRCRGEKYNKMHMDKISDAPADFDPVV